MKKTVLFFLIFLAYNTYCQNFATSLPFLMKKGGKSFSYVDKSKDEAYLFIANSKKIRIAHYDVNFNSIDTLMTALPENNADSMIGFTKNDSSINLIWTSKSGKKFVFQNIDFSTKKTAITTKELDFNNETVLQTFSSNNMFYCLTVINQSDVLKLYCFSNKNELSLQIINTGQNAFTDFNNQRANVYDLIAEEFGSFESSLEFQNVDTAFPNSIVICSKKRKAYFSDDQLFLTFDNNSLSTQIVKINLQDFTSENLKINKPTGIATTNTNSFLFENNLYQIGSSGSKLTLSVKKLDGTEIKEFSAGLNDEISFKSSDFICEWVNPESEKKIENTNQFISKLSNYRIGISCYNYNGKNLISFGGVSKSVAKSSPDEGHRGGYHPGMTSGAIGGLVSAYGVYSNYKSSRNTISVNSLFSKDLELQPEKVNAYSSTKIAHYFNGYSSLRSPTFFSINKKAYIGHYSDDSKQYVIMEFKN
jgi:hypothetical protein